MSMIYNTRINDTNRVDNELNHNFTNVGLSFASQILIANIF